MNPRFITAIIALAALSIATLAWGTGFKENPDFLPVHEAFKVSATGTPDSIQVRIVAAPGYYLYKSKLSFSVSGSGVTAGTAVLPAGEQRSDPYFGDVLVYNSTLSARIPVQNHGDGGFSLRVGFQGCAEKGLCYPPDSQTIQIGSSAGTAATTEWTWWSIALAFSAGLGLVLKPCLLAVAPILSSILLRGEQTARRGLILGLAFALPLAIGYTFINAAIAWLGPQYDIQGSLQSPVVLIPAAALLLFLAAILTGLAALPVPAAFNRQPIRCTSQASMGDVAASAALGVLASVVVAPFVPAPVAGLMMYLSAGGEPGGALQLFALALGMVVPLVLLGILSSKLLGQIGNWVPAARTINAVLLAVVAIWLADRVLPGQLTLALYGLLAVSVAVYLGVFDSQMRWLARVPAALVLVWGVTAWAGMLKGEADATDPLGLLSERTLSWTVVSTPERLAVAIAEAKTAGIPAVVDWYADWSIGGARVHDAASVSPELRSALKEFKLIRVDITAGGPARRKLLELNGLLGPDAVQFIRTNGIESTRSRLIGEVTIAKILDSIRTVAGNASELAAQSPSI
ncbi:protein-disulfide reductase DsbD [Pseudomonas sp. P66]|uniref:Protein-disulfide reductase DsbD n=1 Tax=Pseudomonas arcuscaelestis TaxID=2710591 RepID=A0ABS2BZM7_9PSED|nr:protein-disulfide reductase DsbD [Pseudomonas arcuscaelestis]MBM5459087.1 protein-disulfide reductase DsbD [Pseudomonas arcuscaelestis]